MDSLIEVFHIDIKLLIAQMLNFAIVAAVLYFFALKPLLAIMKERTAKIEKSLNDADLIDEKLEKIGMEYEAAINKAKAEAAAVMARAGQEAEVKREKMIKKAKEEIGAIINSEKEKMRAEKAETLKEIKKEVADLVTLSLEKVLAESVDAKRDKELIKKAVKNIK